jgi:hypothetical protein
MKRIAIVGAGISGLACARRLADEGAEVVVFEKSRSFGGRCASRLWEGCVFDHGAQFFTARSPEFQGWLETLGADVLAIEGSVIDERGGIVAPGARRFYHVGGNNRLGRALAEGLEVRRETLIENITGPSIEGEVFDALVTCVPWPQTQAMLGRLPEKGLYERNVTAAFLYDCPWAGRAQEIYGVSDRSGSALAWSACENHKVGRIPDGRTLFLVQASPDFSAAHYGASRDAWSALLRSELETRWDLDPARRAGNFTHRWGFSRKVGKVDEFGLPDGVFLCGDGQSASRIEDVWLSGHALAGRLLES